MVSSPGLGVPEEAVQVVAGVHVDLDVSFCRLGLLVAVVTVSNLATRTTLSVEKGINKTDFFSVSYVFFPFGLITY